MREDSLHNSIREIQRCPRLPAVHNYPTFAYPLFINPTCLLNTGTLTQHTQNKLTTVCPPTEDILKEILLYLFDIKIILLQAIDREVAWCCFLVMRDRILTYLVVRCWVLEFLTHNPRPIYLHFSNNKIKNYIL